MIGCLDADLTGGQDDREIKLTIGMPYVVGGQLRDQQCDRLERLGRRAERRLDRESPRHRDRRRCVLERAMSELSGPVARLGGGARLVVRWSIAHEYLGKPRGRRTRLGRERLIECWSERRTDRTRDLEGLGAWYVPVYGSAGLPRPG